MVEVFKTNVRNRGHATMLIDQLKKAFEYYEANFDLDDRDNILRIQSSTGAIESSRLIAFLKDFGFSAEVLDECALGKHTIKYI